MRRIVARSHAVLGSRVWSVLVLGFAIAALTGCSTPPDVYGFVVHNDLKHTVKVIQCMNMACTDQGTVDTLKPGANTSLDGLADGEVRAYKLELLSGKTIGCMPFRFKKYEYGPFPLSEHVTCGSDSGAGEIGHRAWPIPTQ